MKYIHLLKKILNLRNLKIFLVIIYMSKNFTGLSMGEKISVFAVPLIIAGSISGGIEHARSQSQNVEFNVGYFFSYLIGILVILLIVGFFISLFSSMSLYTFLLFGGQIGNLFANLIGIVWGFFSS